VHPDVVHICTPHYLHADMIVAALRRNVNVLCEKPMCIREEDIPRILEAERASSAQLAVCHQNRYNGANRFVKDYLADKKVECAAGHVSWHRDAAYYASGAWRGRWETEGGGVLINQALHTFDLLQWFCGMPDTLTASTANLTLDGKIEVEDTATVLCRGENGGNFTFTATNGNVKDCPVEISIRADGEWIKLMPKYVVVGDELHLFKDRHHMLGKTCYGSGHEVLIADFYDCIKTGRKFPIDGTEASKVIRLILAVYGSHGKTVTL
ncbi:MAG: Gfo/Idh/MocA family oxidoreductase, partial [Clostridia bacterium]|nr:Gfo/Idh/MocA family oxidoreductase [Clostridia bacterium]